MGRITGCGTRTVGWHGSTELPKGLLRKIIREDLKLDLSVFNELFERHR